MKITVTKSWKQFFLTGYLYKVSSIRSYSVDDVPSIWYENNLYKDYEPNTKRCALRPEIREWLEDTIPFSDWKAEKTGHYTDTLGILFKKKAHIVMFKLRWG